MYKILIYTHIIVSSLSIVLSTIVSYISVKGWLFRKKYKSINRSFEFLFIVFLYLNSILGLVLYFFLSPQSKAKMMNFSEAQKNADLKYWIIEHFCIMLFALLISHIGHIFTGKRIPDNYKYKYASFYYGIATLLGYFITIAYIFH